MFAWIGYDEFGDRFVRRAVTVARVDQAVGGLAGKSMRIGPLSLGPGGFLHAAAEGVIGTPTLSPRDGGPVAFDVTVPVSLSLRLRVGQETSYHANVDVGLVLTVRAAEPLLLVIDVAPVTAASIRIRLSGSGFGAAILPFVELLEREIRTHLAARVNALVNEPSARAARVIDIAARVDGTPDGPPPREFVWLEYAEFGERFFRHAVTEQRVGESVAKLAGREIAIGPVKAGPWDIATVRATGVVGTPSVSARDAELVKFALAIPVDLDLTVAFGGDHRYRSAIAIHLKLTARAADELQIVVKVRPIKPKHVDVELTAGSMVGRRLQAVAGIEGQIRSQVARTVNAELEDPASRVIDVGARIDGAAG